MAASPASLRTPRSSPRQQSPRGSPQTVWKQTLYRFYLRHYRYALLCIIFPLLLFSQWDIQRHMDALTSAFSMDTSIIIETASEDTSEPTRPSRPLNFTANLFASMKESPYPVPLQAASLPFVVPPNIYKPSSSSPLSVVLIGGPNSTLLDALDRSKYIRVDEMIVVGRRGASNITKWHEMESNLVRVFVVDWADLERDCHRLRRVVAQHRWSPRSQHYFLYMDLTMSSRTVVCEDVTRGWNVRYAKRSMVEGRQWKHTQEWVEPGRRLADPSLLHVPHFLRPAFVEQLSNVTKHLNLTQESLHAVERKLHVAHFWDKGRVLPYAFFRRRISELVIDIGREREGLKHLVRSLGDDRAMEQLSVESRYVETLLSVSVVVVSAHDEWEDHYRLLESMASGAMVLADAMMAPLPGLENGTNIVFYDSPESLKRLILYYMHPKKEKKRLAIGKKGREYAMGTQRGWHTMERLLFGKPLTRVGEPYAPAPKRAHYLDTDNPVSTA